ncbi:ribosomal protein L17 [Trichodelitschia bisporula]|uniref:Large ribosomal subunit protein bL17m n=1 Tax=Trichodelitschia bisporula TaxID=703511 RepID=A0A6G1HTH9_9PEZI|nr:ribosomal protein L17 [Trichodelitschia bisporula]
MAGGAVKYRHLSRNSAHRQALLRNLIESLIEHESIRTTWHKAKETQRLAEKVITLGKKNTEASRRRAWQIFYRPALLVPKVFGELRERYADRPGGYTRVLRIEPIKEDQAASAILELVDGPKDMRFAMTAKTLAHQRREGKPINEITQQNLTKVTRFRKDGAGELEELVKKFEALDPQEEAAAERPQQKQVYPHTDPDPTKKPKKARWTKN